jgi:transcriptional regulator with XRE-family HTH domain
MAVMDKQVIADRLKSLRTSYGLSQQEFAKKVGLSQSAISQFEKAERMPSTAALESIANAFSLPFADLIAGVKAEADTELLISAVAQKMRGMSKDDILTLDRWVDRMGPAQKKDESTES